MGVTTFHSVREGARVKLHRNAKTTPTMRALIVNASGTNSGRPPPSSAYAPRTSGCGGTAWAGGRRSTMPPRPRSSARTPYRLGERGAALDPGDGGRRGRARGPQSAACPRAVVAVTRYERTAPASSCISISNRSSGCSASGIGFTGTARHRRRLPIRPYRRRCAARARVRLARTRP
jgi:hypothetical protein